MVDVSQAIHNEYNSAEVVASYASRRELQPPERAILELLSADLADMRMLDIGVGGGRTTEHFASRVKMYQGVDFSAGMVTACRQRFAGRLPATAFSEADARDLSRFEAGSFDFVLFSYNGIDYLNHEERERTMSEVQRVLSPTGVFAFSTHNTLSIEKLFSLSSYVGWMKPRVLAESLFDWAKLCQRYGKRARRQLQASAYSVFVDGTRATYYIHPQVQFDRLLERFRDVTAFGLERGHPFLRAELHGLRDDWVYFLCQR